MKLDKEYKQWIIEVKQKIRSSQIKATIAVNSALIEFYWDLGKMIAEKQTAYGTGFIPQLSKDLQEEFPEMKGLSVRNLASCREFYQFYNPSVILQQPVAKLAQQYNVQLNEKEYFIDLLFYHIPMQCYVVIELKNKDFEPEFAGKLNFYLTLIDKTMKRSNENPTIGILLCRGKDNLEVEYALQDIHKPMGVSEFKLEKVLPDNLKSSLPSIEELEDELRKMDI
jgi:predicted nuclease of restriction endonuclease-like (RecB) superfamily